ncbi:MULTISPECIES: glycerol kinase GlpK [Paraburkholderia]|uniref:Glycerol kinase n=1 Tax=Paraburkholderia megapolitana TaxID=420953 RepID=A0A1I3I9J3_9BURK|nr:MULTISPECIES: glycerol kinase GlpK [Paraburkholderia]MCX4165663.1 glycerol kinase GlpK [Paraburkholderia megapolitana]MDN7161154.1 glycerol kinase GlpK [Paraburkholderia sp. CHISQ3]MDQ6498201.1 glycerol kinase GlpK [Paraburkholderia megapolitana]QDQ85318.1 glycerol kinase GlpK [Paraburkholderia megapolitana]SFI44611.1 glycerol kinase [Paraburkholderia megapolitana]
MQDQYILALDQGTTSSRAMLFDRQGNIVSVAQKEFQQIYPRPGWVEHDPQEIWSTQAGVAAEAVTRAGLNGTSIAAIGITNQRETTIVWDRETGQPIYNAIVWQDRRTADFCDQLKAKGLEEKVRAKTGLPIDSYFSGTKIRWILDNVEGAREKAKQGKLAFGTVDTWLVWNFTKQGLHVTDVTNASRTMLFNIHTLKWDEELLEALDIPRSMLPEVRPSSEVYGQTVTTVFASKIPLAGIAGDQHAALFGQMCTQSGMVKNTYGTGCFLVMNTGDKPIESKNNLVTTIAWQIGDQINYALEGSIFIAGAVVQWLRDGLGIIKSAADIEKLAGSVAHSDGVYLVPAFAGLGAPHWNARARGTLFGVTRGTDSAHIARAALDSIAYQSLDVLKAMEADSGIRIAELRVDGGACANNLLMQFQADVLGVDVVRPQISETTALGAAYLAGLAVGYWKDVNELKDQWKLDHRFKASLAADDVKRHVHGWQRAVNAAKAWADAD